MARRPAFAVLLAIAAWAGAGAPALAHPHVFVTARAEILYAPDGAVRALKHIWSFDEAYSAYITQGLDKNGDGKLTQLPVTLKGSPLRNLNELEWVNEEIWANVWQTDRIARIDPSTGEVVGLINLAGLLPEEDRLRDTDVLNGIAIDPVTGSTWVTGKRWPWLFEITLENEPD